MACKCAVCYAWQPQTWDPHKGHWSDVVAFCEVKSTNTTAQESCASGNIIRPKGANYAVGRSQSTGGGNKSKAGAAVGARARVISAGVSAGVSGSISTYDRYYPHQQKDFDRYKDAAEGAIFWTMGVGKTALLLGIAAHKFRTKQIDALLVITPNGIHTQWHLQQIPEWLDCAYDCQCLYGRGGATKAMPFDDDPEILQVVCVNVDTFSTPQKWKEVVEWANAKRTMIVLDEATVIKTHNSQRTQRLLYEFNDVVRRGKTIKSSKIKSAARFILTGTPVTNGPIDLWSMMEFVRPSFFGRNYYSFQSHYGMYTKMAVGDGTHAREISIPLNEEKWHAIKAIKEYSIAAGVFGITQDTFDTIHSQDKYLGPYKHADELKTMLEPVATFRNLTDVVDMPPVINNPRLLIMDDATRACYDSMVNEFIAVYDQHTATALNKMTAMIRLQQISSGFICDKTVLTPTEEPEDEDRVGTLFGLADDWDVTPDDPIQWIGNSNPKLEQLYTDITECDKPLIIITRFTAEASRIFDELSKYYSCCLMTGWKRVGTIEAFQAGEYDVMVANCNVVARGFNLQNSHTIIFYSNTFSLEARLQAEGRIFRIGQKSMCQYIDYVYDDSIDEKIVGALQLKRNLLDYIRGTDIKELI